uniref:Sodium channel epithelial 1 subunit delta n=1 Tax=Otus sunia TaxID=257818 RepID=A0A8C8AX78_9STRI
LPGRMEQEAAREEEKKEGLIEFYDSFKDMFEFFCKNTTIHGTIRLVCSDSNRMKTAFWTLLLLASFGMLYWQFALMFSQYWAYPIVLTMSMHSEPKMFPAITICNLDPYRFELVSEHLVQLDHMAEESIAFLYGINTSASLFHVNEKNMHIKDLTSIGNLSRSSFKLSQNFSLLRMSDHNNRSGKKHSSVGFRLCNATGGNCFYKTYSSGMDAILEWYRFHYMNIMSQLPVIINISDHEEQIEDMVYSCQYDGEPCRPRYVTSDDMELCGVGDTLEGRDGIQRDLGLSLILRAEQKDHIPLLSTVAGVKVMIHNHNQTPFLEHEGFDIRPGIATTIGIQQDEVNRLGGNYGKCTTNGNDVNVKLLYNNSYTLQACLHSCFQHIMVRKCGCGYYYYPLPPGAEYCDYNKQPAWGHCFYQLYNRLRNHHLNCFDQCPKPCRKDIAKVTIFYQQLNYQSVNESPLLSENLLLSSMGSQWSLWFGSSVLSVVEMFELLIDTLVLSLLFCYQRFRSKKTLKVAHTPTIPSVSLTLENYRVVQEEAGKGDDSAHTHPSGVTIAMDNSDLHLHPLSSKVEMPELCPDVVLNGFRYTKDSSVEGELKG